MPDLRAHQPARAPGTRGSTVPAKSTRPRSRNTSCNSATASVSTDTAARTVCHCGSLNCDAGNLRKRARERSARLRRAGSRNNRSQRAFSGCPAARLRSSPFWVSRRSAIFAQSLGLPAPRRGIAPIRREKRLPWPCRREMRHATGRDSQNQPLQRRSRSWRRVSPVCRSH